MKFIRMGVVSIVLLVLVGLSAVGLSNGSVDEDALRIEAQLGLRGQMVTADPAGTLDSTWYCAATRVLEGSAGNHQVVIANGSDEVAPVEVRGVAFSSKGEVAPPQKLELAAHTVETIDVATLVQGSSAAVIVEVRSGEVVVSHRLANDTGASQVPCVPQPSNEWHFPYVNTEKDATARLFLFNPYPVAVSVDVTLSTTDYVRVPAELSGESVPAGSVKAINLNERAPRRDRLSVSVRSRSGLVVAEVVQTFAEDNLAFNQTKGEGKDEELDEEELGKQPVPRQGVAIVSGTPVMTESAGFVDGFTQGGVIEQFVVLNAGAGQDGAVDPNAEVSVAVTPYGQEAGEIEPFQKTVPPGRAETIAIDSDQRIPPEGFHHASVTADVPVAAARVLVSTAKRGDGDASGSQLRPKGATGVSVSPALPVAATRWWSGGFGLGGDDEGWLLVHNPSLDAASSLKVLIHGGGEEQVAEGLDDLKVDAADQVAINLRDLELPDLAMIEVRSSAPVQVERRLVDTAAGDYSSGPAVPDASTLVPLFDATSGD